MVDIAAQLTLTASGPAIDPAAILGAETADSQAFGAILAGQVAGSVQANADTGTPATPLPPFPAPAGNRQPGGKILPGAAQILPDAAPLGVEAPAAQILPTIAAISAVRLVSTPSLTKLVPQPHVPAEGASDTAADISAPKPAEASPVHGLIKMLTAALKGQRPTAAPAEEAQEAAEKPGAATAGAEADTSAQAASTDALVLPTLQFVVPVAAAVAVAGPLQTGTSETRDAVSGRAVPTPAAVVPPQADAAVREQIQPALAQLAPVQQVPTQQVSPQQVSGQPVPAQAVPASVSVLAEAPAVPVLPTPPALTVAPVAGISVAAVTLVTAPALPTGQTVSVRVKVAAPTADKDGSILTGERPAAAQPSLADPALTAETPIVASRTAPTIRAILAERVAIDPTIALATADGQPSLAAAPSVTSAPAAPVPTTGAPIVEMPRQDFAALVERLVEARNAAVPQSTHASLNHAEFGQVSLHFEQDGGDLKVAMSSADPDFARAAQAAQAAQPTTPAERQNFTADTNSRGQSQNQSPSANSSSQSHHQATDRDSERSDHQGRNAQGRNSRGGDNSSNPSPRWAGRDQPQTRGGIFA